MAAFSFFLSLSPSPSPLLDCFSSLSHMNYASEFLLDFVPSASVTVIFYVRSSFDFRFPLCCDIFFSEKNAHILRETDTPFFFVFFLFIMGCLLRSSKTKAAGKKVSLPYPHFYIHNTSFQPVSRCQSTSSHVTSGAHWQLHWGHFHMSDRDNLHGSQGSSPTPPQDPDVKSTVTQLCATDFSSYFSVRIAAA